MKTCINIFFAITEPAEYQYELFIIFLITFLRTSRLLDEKPYGYESTDADE